MSVALIAPPWPLFNRPSIQIGALKAWLKRSISGLQVTSRHPYLDLACRIGYLDYHRISQSSWAAEAVYAALLYPERAEDAEELYRSSLKRRWKRDDLGQGSPAVPPFQEICTHARKSARALVASLRLESTGLVGISACLNQFTAGLYLARLIKEVRPETAVVMGGSSVSGGVAHGILQAFPYLDFIIEGEGELPLQGLVEFLAGIRRQMPRAVTARASAKVKVGAQGCGSTEGQRLQIEDLGALPIPDYDDYFRELSRLPAPPALSITLPVEVSRGCWWGKCSFCNLNLQWKGYRAKDPEEAAGQIDRLSRRYQILDFALMDNCLPPKGAKRLFEALAATGKDFQLFCELRAVHGRDEYRSFASGGLRHLQVGIEALSTSLLRRLNKGASVIDNLAALRHAAENGIEIGANLITRFPGSTEAEAEETIRNLEFAWPFAPLKAVPFWLGRCSPVFNDPKSYGIKAMRPAPEYRRLFPDQVLEKLEPLILVWTGDRKRQERTWKKVEKRVQALFQTRKGYQEPSLLTWRDGGEFITIRQRLPDGRVLNHRLSGPSRQIYLAAQDVIETDELAARFAQNKGEKLKAFISDLAEKRLMFKEGNRVLALATRQNTGGLLT